MGVLAAPLRAPWGNRPERPLRRSSRWIADTEVTSNCLDHWVHWNRVRLDFSRPGEPTEAALAEAFDSILRRECLSHTGFVDLVDARRISGSWRTD